MHSSASRPMRIPKLGLTIPATLFLFTADEVIE
jgi:hypothetical protein